MKIVANLSDFYNKHKVIILFLNKLSLYCILQYFTVVKIFTFMQILSFNPILTDVVGKSVKIKPAGYQIRQSKEMLRTILH